ncbi:cell wall metabolism sensor histidine kinase WalK [Georgenia sp. SYP-B2076]|uniref:sensor histidine kinase n=1 Tax=Georgenia sp. SYP-B2076 TaxID=2495881 RepID=UPI000F8EB886|nr:ATP-binding protein [Georgenia sp. SYP-B2076]
MRAGGLGVRASTTLAATLVVAVILALAGVSLTMLLRRELVAGVDTSAGERAADIISMLDTATLRSVVPATQDAASLVQVLDAHGNVIAASSTIEGQGPMARPSSTLRYVTDPSLRLGGGTPYRLLLQPAGTPQAPRTVVVAMSLGPADRAVEDMTRLIAAIFPGVLALTGLVAWISVGRALAPVERIRRKAATIGAGDLSQRVPLPQAHDEVHRLAVTMNSMLARIQASTERRRHFVSDASHELRSPLANMQAMLEVALARHDLQLWQETGADLQAEQARMRRLVDDLLLLARLDGRVPVQQREVDLDDVVHGEAQRLRRYGKVAVEVAPLPALRVRGDANQLARVVRNLTDNAHRHARTTVWLSLRADGDDAVVRVADDGAGVPPEHRERIFDRFTRLDEARGRDLGGSGLGLPISRAIAQAHGGSLELVPEEGPQGAVFDLRLPHVPDGAPHQPDPERTERLRSRRRRGADALSATGGPGAAGDGEGATADESAAGAAKGPGAAGRTGTP